MNWKVSFWVFRFSVSNEKICFLHAEGEKGKDYTDPIPFQTNIINTLDGNAKYWIGKDYVNFIIKDLVNLEAPYVDIVDRTQTPRMPWHDIGAVVGERKNFLFPFCLPNWNVFLAGASARDISRHFIQRWNAVKLEKARENTVSLVAKRIAWRLWFWQNFGNFLSRHTRTFYRKVTWT